MKAIILGLALVATGLAWADTPECDKNGQAMSIDNDRVIQMKHSTPNNYHDRAFVKGTVSKVYPDATGHSHFELTIVGSSSDTIELIYNQDFGNVPGVNVGQDVVACGDYITSNANSGRYRASPDGALIHWLHRSDSPRHDSGFFVIDGTVVGL